MMKRKLLTLLLTVTMLCGLAACGATNDVNAETNTPAPTKEAVPATKPANTPTEAPADAAEPTKAPSPTNTPAPVAKTVSPLPVTIDMNNLNNCTVAVSFEKGDAYVDDTGVMRLKVKVYTYDLYDMIDIAMLAEGDTILLRGEELLITSLERTDSGAVLINGGLDEGGFELRTDGHTVYYETGYSDVKSYYELGEATLRVSADFIFTDKMDLDNGPFTYYPGDFLTEEAGIFYCFTADNTTIVIQDGQVVAMERVYTP